MQSIKGIEQGRAAYAYQCAEQGKALGAKEGKEYKAYVKKIPAMIKTNGLGAAFAFVFAKGSNGGKADERIPHGLIYIQTAEWLKKGDNKYLLPQLNDTNKLVEKIIQLDSASYRHLTVEVLALFAWIKRFADGLITGVASSNTP